MKILLINPETPHTFWSFKKALKFVSKKANDPPLGLLTVAAMLPKEWELILIDMNVRQLQNKHISWADYVFISGMNIQKKSFVEVVQRCNNMGVKVVAGGPMVTTEHEHFEGVDHFVLNEAEITLSPFIDDLVAGCAKQVYRTDDFPELSHTPIPRWDLLETKKYSGMSLQYSRGCPFDCEFCSITMLNGRKPRVKETKQFLTELESLYTRGWRGPVFIVDDNFIGHKKMLKKELMPALIRWAEERGYPFRFTTEVTMNLADDEDLSRMMVQAGFVHVFIGIETPNDESLAECGKAHNMNRNMVDSVLELQRKGLRVSGGFILGFDNDPPSIFEKQIQFIQKSGIVTAMVGILNAPTGTRLFHRMKKENRLLGSSTGDNMDGSINFMPVMPQEKLMSGYKKVIQTVYAPKEYYERVRLFIKEFKPFTGFKFRLNISDLRALFKSIWVLGIRDSEKKYYWKLVAYSLFRHPKKLPVAIEMAIYGFHFRSVVDGV